ncbi:hypothetical protein AAOGI_32640 [Agarivorans albus]|uniref:DUF3299 domain-containing protein n=1 Tax=Agarivorans sp. JK6 TaxID=2997426 RepID=UPI0037E6EAD2
MLNKLIGAAILLFTLNAQSADFVELQWEELKPHPPEQVKLPDLSQAQIAQLQEVLNLAMSEQEKDKAELAKVKANLRLDGIDADKVLALRQQYIEQQELAALALTSAHDGKLVRMPGFLVPLEFSESMVGTDFLLVPYAGACIHMPPPPANQIVRVSFPKGFKLKNYKYPVWVEGVISSNLKTENLYIVDGYSDLTMGYTMSASLIEDYEY